MNLKGFIKVFLGVFILLTSFFLFSDPVKAQSAEDLGSISATVTWQSEPVEFVRLYLVGNTTGFSWNNAQYYGGSFNTGYILPPDTYTLTAKVLTTNGDDLFTVGSQTVTVAGGQSVTGINIDASTASGLVKGNLKVNGVSTGGSVQFCSPVETDPCLGPVDSSKGPLFHFQANGFYVALPPGDYRLHVVTNSGLNAGVVPITVTGGQITEGSSLQFSLNLGSISATVTWQSEPVEFVRLYLVGNTTGFSWNNAQYYGGSFNTGYILPPDTYTLTAKVLTTNGDDLFTVGSQTVTVAGGQSVTGINIDASTASGLVKGNLKVNGVSTGGSVQFCSPVETDPCLGPVDSSKGPLFHFQANGFYVALPPGDYRLHVVTNSDTEMGILPISVTVGEKLDLTTNTVNIPTGQNVDVTLAGATITFSEVTTSGFMSAIVTTHPQGGQPPSQYRFLGNYYELTTTASYTGPITVQFSYNEADVHGPEANLKLWHWDGAQWVDITTSVDTVNNTITGVTNTLSPFALGEPLNTPPDAGEITAPLDPVQINTSINTSVSFVNSDTGDSHTVVWNWGDGTTSEGSVTETNGAVTGNHVYTLPGVYTVKVKVTDSFGELDESVFQFVVVYNPDGGFVTGGGWIDSPTGAYVADSSLTGKANFGFVSKYEQGATVPTGQTEFQFKVANFSFKSTNYEWLVVAGPNAKYKGSGTINGEGDYGFMLTAGDGQINGGGGADKFRIKIWDKTTGNVIYDNQLGNDENADASDAIEGGSIVIHN